MSRPLEGVRVADFCWVGAGSYTTKMLADLGADVVKIESGKRLDSLRLARPYKDGIKGVNRSGYFADRNTSKRGVTLNLKNERARDLARRLILWSDVTANNFTPGTLDRLGLGYQGFADEKPELIFVEMSMQGADGPARDYLGYGATIAALCGLQYLTGLPGRDGAGTGTNYPDHIPNPCHAAFAILAALRHRRRTGRGQYVDLAQSEPTIATLGTAMMAASASMQVAPSHNGGVAHAPAGVYPTEGEDRWIAIDAANEGQWRALVLALERNDLASDPRFADAQSRIDNREALDAELSLATRRHPGERLMELLQDAGVAAGVVRDAKGVVADDPQLAHRGHWVTLEHPEMGASLYSAPPYRFTRAEVGIRSRAPLLGEHTDAVCGEVLGLCEEEIAELRAEGALE